MIRAAERTIHGNVAQSSGAVVLNVSIRRIEQTDKNGDSTGVDQLLPVLVCVQYQPDDIYVWKEPCLPEWVMFNRAPVAFRWTLTSFDRARRVSGTRAPDFAILVLLSSEIKFRHGVISLTRDR